MYVNPLGKVIVVIAQSENALHSSLLMVEGKFTVLSRLHAKNEASPMVVMPSLNVTDSMVELAINALE